MPSCSVKWCSNHTSTCSLKSKNGVSFHRFPKDEAMCQKWVEAVRHERRDPWWTSTNASRICSLHFKESDISSTPCKVNILSKTAVPVCTMIWYDENENENNITSKTSSEETNTDKILKTYERKKTHMNVLKESKESNVPQELDTNLLKTWKVSKINKLKEFLNFNSVADTNLTTNANEVKKKSVLTELKDREHAKSYEEKCKIKINDNTSFILDEDLNNDTELKEPNRVAKETNTKTCENSLKVSKELKSNENRKPNQNIPNKSVETITEHNVDLNANISNNNVGKRLKTYMPKRRDKISETKNTMTGKPLTKNNSLITITKEIGLNAVKCVEVNHCNVNINPNNDVNIDLSTGACFKSNKKADLQLNENSQEIKHLYVFKNENVNQNIIVGKKPNPDADKESKIVDIDEIITNQSGIDDIKGTDSQVIVDEIIAELFENPDVSDIYNSDCQKSNENMCVESNETLGTHKNIDSDLYKQIMNMPVILDSDNSRTELNTLVNLDLISDVNVELNNHINTEVNKDKTSVNESLLEFDENTVTMSSQQVSIMNENIVMEHSDYFITGSHYDFNSEGNGSVIIQCNKNMFYNDSTKNNVKHNKELQNKQPSVVSIIVTDSKQEKFTELKKCLSSKPKVDSLVELYTNNVIDIERNLFPEYNNIMSNVLKKEKQKIPFSNHNTEFNKNIDIKLNNNVKSLQSNIYTEGSKETYLNLIGCKQLNSILLEDFMTNLSPVSNHKENMDFIKNFLTEPNSIRESELNKRNTSDINVELKSEPGKNMPELDTITDFGAARSNSRECSDVNTDKNTEFNTDITNFNEDFTQYNDNTVTESNQSNHLISESNFLLSKNEGDMQNNKSNCYSENTTSNVIILSNIKLQNPSFENNIDSNAQKDKFTELKKHLSTKSNLDTFAELSSNTITAIDTNLISRHSNIIFKKSCHNKINMQVPAGSQNTEFDKRTDIDINNIDPLLQPNININATKEIESTIINTKEINSFLVGKFISSESNNYESKNFVNSLNRDLNTTGPSFNNKMSSNIDIECKKNVAKDMPDLNTDDIAFELKENHLLKSEEDMNRKNNKLNNEMYKDLIFQKSNKDVENALPNSDDQHIVVNKHLDVVDSILNTDTVSDFDLSLLLSDSPIPDEEIQNVGSNSNNNFDAFKGSKNWIQLPADENPKIIDEMLDPHNTLFENLDLFDTVNNANLDKVAYKKDNEIEKPIKKIGINSNFEKFDGEFAHNICESVKQCTENSTRQTEKELILEFSDFNETSLEQSSSICNEKKISQCKIFRENCNETYYEPTDKQLLEQYLQTKKEICAENNLDKNVDCYKQSKEIPEGNLSLDQGQQYSIDLKEHQIEDPSINPYFEQSEVSLREQNNTVGIDNLNKLLNYKGILEMDRKHYDNTFNGETNGSSIDKPIVTRDEILKSKIQNQDTFSSSLQEINNQLPEDFNNKRIEEMKYISNEARTEGTKSTPELKSEQLKKVILEQCFDPELEINCKKHNSNIELGTKDLKQYKKPTNYTSCQIDVKNRKRGSDLVLKIGDLKKQLNYGFFNPYIKQKPLIKHHKMSDKEKYITKYKKIAIDRISGKYLELRWKEKEENCNITSQKNCKRKHKELGLEPRKIRCTESTNEHERLSTQRNFDQSNNNCENQNGSSTVMAECPECGYTTDDNDLITYKTDVDLRITKPLSLINKHMFLSHPDRFAENNSEDKRNNKRVAIESVYAMELAYATAIQALEKKLKQKIAISEHRQQRVKDLSKINNNLMKANVLLMNIAGANKL